MKMLMKVVSFTNISRVQKSKYRVESRGYKISSAVNYIKFVYVEILSPFVKSHIKA